MRARLILGILVAYCLTPNPLFAQLTQPDIQSVVVPMIEKDGLRFRDLNRSGTLDPYEDWRLTPQLRASDLVGRMTLAEKSGAAMHGNFPEVVAPGTRRTISYNMELLRPLLLDGNINSFLTRLAISPTVMAEQNNAVQRLAEEGRLGIPVTVSTDPRHHFLYITGQSSDGRGYSQWPETIGFAALRQPATVQKFAKIAAREYRATGIQQALSPQVDLFTEPRWARGYGGFGSSPSLSRKMAKAYVEGFQGGGQGLTKTGVLTTIKHWVAYGATINGLDSHSAYGQISRVNNRSFKLQIEPFLGGFDASVGAVMPTYSIIEGIKIDGKPSEPVAAGFSDQLINSLLRGTYKFKGIVLSDWAITNDCGERCTNPTAELPQTRAQLGMPWGVEKLTRRERFAKAMNAGVDQFGGVAEPGQISSAVESGLLKASRLDEAVTRIMTVKFEMGLFENPYVDVGAINMVVNPPEVAALAANVQAEAQVLLKDPKKLLPLRAGSKVFASGVSADTIRAAGFVPVDDASMADVALVRVNAPYETLHPHHYIGSLQHEGRLDFAAENPDLKLVKGLAAKVPVITSLFLDRPAVLGEMNDASSAILANFGVSDAALLAVISGKNTAKGKMPFELPSSMAAVEKQDPALPDDTRKPLYSAGSGIVRKR